MSSNVQKMREALVAILQKKTGREKLKKHSPTPLISRKCFAIIRGVSKTTKTKTKEDKDTWKWNLRPRSRMDEGT